MTHHKLVNENELSKRMHKRMPKSGVKSTRDKLCVSKAQTRSYIRAEPPHVNIVCACVLLIIKAMYKY